MRAILIPMTVVTLVAASAPAVAAAAVPLVLDVDLKAACGQAVQGRMSMYAPQGGQAEWRVRAGDTVQTGTVTMTHSVTTASFTLPQAGSPVLVDVRAAGGVFGPVWWENLSQGCDPVRVVSAGDSVVWNQGVAPDRKFPHLVASMLGDATGRGYEHFDHSISGAVLDAPDLPAGNNDRDCLREKYFQDPDDDGEMELGEVTVQMPDVFCQLEKAGSTGEEIDLVILNGCINDMDPLLGIPLGITPGTEDVPAAVTRECGGVGAAPTNPAKDVPYFSGAKVGYGGRGMRAAIEKAHSLPGRPKVLVVDFYYALSRASGTPPTTTCTDRGYTAAVQTRCLDSLVQAPQRYEQFTRHSAEAYRQAVAAANAASPDGPYAVAANGLFTVDNAVLAGDPKVWQSPTEDEMFPLRRNACPEFSATPPQCLTAAIAHPNVAGSRQYAENFLLNPALRTWFGLPVPRTAPLVVTPSGDLRAPAVPGAVYRWYFGDGTAATTDSPTITHSYTASGPHLPRVVVEAAGAKSLHEAQAPVIVG